MNCIHCGAELDFVTYNINVYLSTRGRLAFECPRSNGMPACEPGQKWYKENTLQTLAGPMLTRDAELRLYGSEPGA